MKSVQMAKCMLRVRWTWLTAKGHTRSKVNGIGFKRWAREFLRHQGQANWRTPRWYR